MTRAIHGSGRENPRPRRGGRRRRDGRRSALSSSARRLARCGGLRLEHVYGISKLAGYEAHIVGPREIAELHPYLDTVGVKAAFLTLNVAGSAPRVGFCQRTARAGARPHHALARINHTPDGVYLSGPAPGPRNYWMHCGASIGVCQGAGAGKYLAQWMMHGQAEINMREFDPRCRRWRMEKAYRSWGAELTNEVTLIEAGAVPTASRHA